MDPPRIAADAAPAGPRYRFDGIVVDALAHTVLRDGQPLALEPKTFAVLLVLLHHPGELLERDQLLDAVWGHRHVTPGVLTRAIAQLRHALGDDPHQPHYIQTQHALGYRFIGQLQDPDETSPRAARRATDRTGPDADARPPQPDSPLLAKKDHAALAGPGTQAPAPRPGPATTAAGNVGTGEPTTAMHLAGQGSGVGTAAGARRAPRAGPPAGPGRGKALRLAGLALLALVLVLVLAWRGWSTRETAGPAPAVESSSGPVAPQDPDPSPASIVVLPFTSLSVDRNDVYFAQGLAEELRDALADVPGLQVATLPTAGDAGSAPPDFKALGVATVLDASVRREGRRIRINARLIDTATGYTLWSDSYDRETDDVLALQTELANEVVDALRGVLRPAQPATGQEDAAGVACSRAPVRTSLGQASVS